MDQLASDLKDFANGYFQGMPVVNSTGLTGEWDYDLIWTGKGQLARAGSDGVSIFDAVEKGLGLKLDLQTAPRPVLLVDAAKETPTPNSPELAKLMPPPLPAVFRCRRDQAHRARRHQHAAARSTRIRSG